MNSIFCIPCKYTYGNNIIFECIKNIRQHHVNVDILVVDSGSDDISYLETLKKEYNILYDEYKNFNYPTGAYWHCYNNYKRDFYYFIHDSIIIDRNISEYEKNEVTSLLYFKSYLKEHIYNNPIIEEQGCVGMVGPKTIVDWGINELEKNNIKPNYFFTGLVGSAFLVNNDVMDKIKKTGFHNILPKDKLEDGQMERLWGVIFNVLGYDVINNTIMGDYLNVSSVPSKEHGSDFVKKNNGISKFSFSRH